jgi:ABC-type uncharacterized transport system permease subunit
MSAGLGVALPCLWLDQIVPWYIIFPAAILGSALVGGFWAFIPAWLQAKRGSHVVITTIMFNFIASSLMVYRAGRRAQAGRFDGAADPHLC